MTICRSGAGATVIIAGKRGGPCCRGADPERPGEQFLKGEKPVELPLTQSINNKYVDFVAPPRPQIFRSCFLGVPPPQSLGTCPRGGWQVATGVDTRIFGASRAASSGLAHLSPPEGWGSFAWSVGQDGLSFLYS